MNQKNTAAIVGSPICLIQRYASATSMSTPHLNIGIFAFCPRATSATATMVLGMARVVLVWNKSSIPPLEPGSITILWGIDAICSHFQQEIPRRTQLEIVLRSESRRCDQTTVAPGNPETNAPGNPDIARKLLEIHRTHEAFGTRGVLGNLEALLRTSTGSKEDSDETLHT